MKGETAFSNLKNTYVQPRGHFDSAIHRRAVEAQIILEREYERGKNVLGVHIHQLHDE